MKRFYKVAGASKAEGGYQIHLDGKPVNTPAKARLLVPNRAIAEAIAEEWNSQHETIDPATMPLTQLVNTTIDRVAREREAVVTGVLAFAETDLLCYRAEQPAALADRQAAAWQPLLDWAALELDAPLSVTNGVLPVPQPPASLAAFGALLGGYDDFRLAVVAHAAGLLGSIVLAIALAAGRITAAEAFELANLDEAYQHENWGTDSEAVARLERRRLEISATERFLGMLDR